MCVFVCLRDIFCSCLFARLFVLFSFVPVIDSCVVGFLDCLFDCSVACSFVCLLGCRLVGWLVG